MMKKGVMIMASKRDYYEVLGIKRDADQNTIKKAYRKLAKQYHPDTNSGNAKAEETFKELSEAYSVLNDPEKKKLYDRFGHAAFDGGASGGGDAGAYGFKGQGNGGSYGYRGPNGSYQEYHFDGDDMDDILRNIFGGGFSRADYAHGFGGSTFRQKGADIQAEMEISFDEAVFGCDKFLNLSGSHGSSSGSTLKVHIPAGIDQGQSIRLRGKGMPGSGGGEPGDLLLKVNIGSKPGFERRGNDVYTTVSIPFTTAVLGGKAMVQTLYGKVMCKIQPGTQSGTKIRLKDKGIAPMGKNGQRGCQYVTIQIQVPQNLSEKAKAKLQEFENACGSSDQGAA